MQQPPAARRGFIRNVAVVAGTIGIAPSVHADEEKPVTATEDLMREHGILRRALLVIRACATRLEQPSARVRAGSDTTCRR